MKLSLILALCLLASCTRGTPKPERLCEVRGEVIRLDDQVRTATIRHQKICDWMEPMTMEFPLRNQADFDRLRVGARIRATVHIGNPEYWLGAVEVQPQ